MRTAGMIVVSAGLVVGLAACGGPKGQRVFERSGNGATSGVVQAQPGNYALYVSCTDKRSKSSKKRGASPRVTLDANFNGQEEEASAFCTGSRTTKFALPAPTTVNLSVSVSGSATYKAELLKQK
jgi:hypothetical protein